MYVCVNVCVCMWATSSQSVFFVDLRQQSEKIYKSEGAKKTPIHGPTNSDHDCDAASETNFVPSF